jgi:peroxiredoxin
VPEQAPALVELEQRFRGKGVAVLGVSWEPAENVQDFAREFGEEWPQVSEPEDRGPIHLAYRAISYPRFVLIGRDGRLVALDPQFEELEALLRGLVASPD